MNQTPNHRRKSFAIISLIALASVGIGLFQQSRLARLKRESIELARETPGSSSEKLAFHPRRRDSHFAAQVSSNESLADLEALTVSVFKNAASARRGYPVTAEEQAAAKESHGRLLKALAALDPAEILELIQRLKFNPDLPENLREKPEQAFVEMLMEANPKVLLDVIPHLKDYPEMDKVMADAFGRWLRASPAAATRWFDGETEKGSPLVRSAGVFGNVIIEESRFDPSRALSRALSQEAVENPKSIVNLGANIALRLDDADDNLAFFAALRRAVEKSPGSDVLADIRRTFVDGLGRRLY